MPNRVAGTEAPFENYFSRATVGPFHVEQRLAAALREPCRLTSGSDKVELI
jgi:hypothetical protein